MNGNRVFGNYLTCKCSIPFLHNLCISFGMFVFLAWNIMSFQQMKAIAAESPTTIEELAECGLPENIVKDYGERLLKNINAYIGSNNLRSYIDSRPKKKPKFNQVAVAAAVKAPDVINVLDDSGDEFDDDGIDFSSIPLPTTNDSAKTAETSSKLKSSNKTSSSYFK